MRTSPSTTWRGGELPALFNGMATGADWMSAASFIGMAGTLYLPASTASVFVMGWTGGYCMVALFLAPYLRKFGQFTIPDFLGARYGGNIPRAIGVFAAILCSFTYVIAQIYGVGIITSRFTGVEFAVGVFLGLAGILVCSFLGGMRAVTWTQVAQYIILIIAYMIPVVWLSVKITGWPVPQLVYGQVLEKNTAADGTSCESAAGRSGTRYIQAESGGREGAHRCLAGVMGIRRKPRLPKKVEDLKAANAPTVSDASAQLRKRWRTTRRRSTTREGPGLQQVASNTAQVSPALPARRTVPDQQDRRSG